MSACQVGGVGCRPGSLVPLTFCCDPSIWPGSGACVPPLQPRRGLPGPASCRSADSALNSLRNPTEAGTGRSCRAGTPAGVREVSLRRDLIPGAGLNHSSCVADGISLSAPAWVPAPLFHRSCGRPWLSLSLGAESQGWSWGEVPERPRWCQGLGCGAAGGACSWRDGGRAQAGQVSAGAQGHRSSEGDGSCHFCQ